MPAKSAVLAGRNRISETSNKLDGKLTAPCTMYMTTPPYQDLPTLLRYMYKHQHEGIVVDNDRSK